MEASTVEMDAIAVDRAGNQLWIGMFRAICLPAFIDPVRLRT